MVTINSSFDSGTWEKSGFNTDFEFTDIETDIDPSKVNPLTSERFNLDRFETSDLRANYELNPNKDWTNFPNSEEATGKEPDNKIAKTKEDKDKTESEEAARDEAEGLIANLEENEANAIAEAKKILLAEGGKKKIWDMYNSLNQNIPHDLRKIHQLNKLFGYSLGDMALNDKSNLQRALNIFIESNEEGQKPPASLKDNKGGLHGNIEVYISRSLREGQTRPTNNLFSPIPSLLYR